MNLKTKLQDLIESGLTQAQIAELCGGWQSQISGLLSGARKSVHYPLGDAIAKLHAERCQREEVAA